MTLLLQRLRRLRWWLPLVAVVAALVAVVASYEVRSAVPPKISVADQAYAVATTSLLVDTQPSLLRDIEAVVPSLISRASVFAEVSQSTPVKAQIASLAGISADQFIVAAVTASDRARQAAGQGAVSPALAATGVVFSTLEEGPIVRVEARAATSALAQRLADAGSSALRSYVGEQVPDPRPSLQERDGEPTTLVLRPLGAVSTVIVPADDPLMRALALGAGAFVGLVVLLLLLDRLLIEYRASKVSTRLRHQQTEP